MAYSFKLLKVLVVDDDQRMRTLIWTVLNAFGIKEIFKAGSAQEAWDILKKNPCDLVLLDWEMKGGNGLEFAKKIRTTEDSPNAFVPIIMLTGYANMERVQAARDAGINEFLAKPVSSKAVLSRLVAVIEHPRPYVRTKSYFGPCRRRRDDAYHGPERRIVESETIKPKRATASAA